MEEYAKNIFCTNEEKTSLYCKCIVEAVEKTHEVNAKLQSITRKAKEALETKNKRIMWDVLQKYLYKYFDIFTTMNGVQLKQVDGDFYESISVDYLANQLEIVIGVLYLNEAKHSVAKETIKVCLEKILKQKGLYSEYEILKTILN